MGQVYGVISIKGGVGKTTSVISLGAALGMDHKKKVLLVDANFSAPNLSMYLGITDPHHSIQEVMAGSIEPRDAIITTNHGFCVMPGLPFKKKINPYKLRNRVIERLRENYDFIIIDSSPNLNEEVLAVIIASDKLLAVTTPDIVTLHATLMAAKSAGEKNSRIDGLILNKVYNKRYELGLEDIEKVAGCGVLAVVPHDTWILEAMARNIPPSLHTMADSGVEYRKLAAVIAGEHYKDYRPKAIIKQLFWKSGKEEINREIYRIHS